MYFSAGRYNLLEGTLFKDTGLPRNPFLEHQAICFTYSSSLIYMSDTSDTWRGWVKWYEIPKPPWTTGSNLNWIVPASPPDRTKFMIISQGQTHTWLYLRDRHRQNLPGGTDAMQKRHEKAKRHWENRRGDRHAAHSPYPITYTEEIESPLIIGISVTSMPGRRKLSEGAVNNRAELSTIL